MKKQKFEITLNQVQLGVVMSALEVFTRLHSGQWDMAFDNIFRFGHKDLYKKMDADFDIELRTSLGYEPNKGTFYKVLDFFKGKLLGLPANAGFGIGNKQASVDMSRAYDLLQVLRFAYSENNKIVVQYDMKNKLPVCKRL